MKTYDKHTADFMEMMTKQAGKDMPDFEDQNRPEKTKEIYAALKRDHPNMPAEMKARIAARHGKPGSQKQGPPYKAPIKEEYSKEDKNKDKKMVENTSKVEREEMNKEAGIADLWKGVKSLAGRMFRSKKDVATADKYVGTKVTYRITTNEDMKRDFRARPFTEKQAILAKAREIANSPLESKSRKAKASALLKALEGL